MLESQDTPVRENSQVYNTDTRGNQFDSLKTTLEDDQESSWLAYQLSTGKAAKTRYESLYSLV